MKIGDTVKSKNVDGQIKIEGKMVALIKADYYISHMLPKGVDPGVTWDKTCPNWRDEEVAIIFFNFPQRTATYEEWVESGVKQGYDRKYLEESYERSCPFTQEVVFPVADLQLA
jgi:hypothetical protein